MPDSKIKLFVDAHCFDAEYQGSRTFVKEIYRELAHKNDIILFLAAYDLPKLKESFPATANTVFLQYKSKSSIIRLAFDIPRLIKKHQIDFAHFQYITPLIKNCKQVVTIHDVIFNDYPEEFSSTYRLFKKFLYKRSAATADILTTVSFFSKSSIQKHLQTKERGIHVLPNGVSEPFFEYYDKLEAKTYIKAKYGFERFILYVSRIEPRKNHKSLLKAFSDLGLHQKNYQLVFIGHSSLQVKGLKDAIPASVKKSVHFINGIDDTELLHFYRAAEIFIYPSKAEGFGIPPLEAGAAKVPVICSNTSAMKDFTFFGDYHVDPTDSELLRQKLSDLIKKNPEQAQLDAISETIKEQYSWKTSAEKLYHLITKK